MSEHPKTEIMRSMSNRYPLPRVVEEMLYLAADEIDALRAKVAAVEALCDLWEHGSHFRIAARKIRAAISGPVDDA